ncbi:MAG: glutamine--tRNA ligase/YqeY domain fusion protein [Pseudomonadota bacterium]|nr:glutamine--tRNA ligase/YqeY domain fusion protein [Pseudomonadota bacterium]
MDFIRKIIEQDLAAKTVVGVMTRFPPEPNGFLHIGHAKAIVLNFDIAAQYNGECLLRFDDTNPEKEEQEYIDAIKRDVRWLGFRWQRVTYASDYFQTLYEDACRLIAMGKAYVCELSADEIRTYRGTLTDAGRNSPYRERPRAESLRLFKEMQAGLHSEGKMVLRAKIDMSAPNICMRDPTIYRIKHLHHHRTGDKWKVYPMYDFTHCLCDASENITHSLCTLEFQDNRALYDWFVQTLRPPPHPKQIEFARFMLNSTITSKRKLKTLVDEGKVNGWDDPRMPTLSGLRRRGYPPLALKNLFRRLGVSKKETILDYGQLEDEVRNTLNSSVPRSMGVLKPLKVIITNLKAVESIAVPVYPQRAGDEQASEQRTLSFAPEIYIDADDFREQAARSFFRLTKDQPVRLRYAYVITCQEIIYDADGNITALHCRYDPSTAGGKKPSDGTKVRGIIHWIAACDAVRAKVRVYDRMLTADASFNTQSLQEFADARIDRQLVANHQSDVEQSYQLERVGYFCVDDQDSTSAMPVLNQVVSLRGQR